MEKQITFYDMPIMAASFLQTITDFQKEHAINFNDAPEEKFEELWQSAYKQAIISAEELSALNNSDNTQLIFTNSKQLSEKLSRLIKYTEEMVAVFSKRKDDTINGYRVQQFIELLIEYYHKTTNALPILERQLKTQARPQESSTISNPKPQPPNPEPSIIKTAQENLMSIHLFKGPADGVIDSQTSFAISNFQERYNLPVTGELNSQTAELIAQIALENRSRKNVNNMIDKIEKFAKSFLSAINTLTLKHSKWYTIANNRNEEAFGNSISNLIAQCQNISANATLYYLDISEIHAELSRLLSTVAVLELTYTGKTDLDIVKEFKKLFMWAQRNCARFVTETDVPDADLTYPITADTYSSPETSESGSPFGGQGASNPEPEAWFESQPPPTQNKKPETNSAPRGPYFNKSSLSEILTDSTDADIKDQLSFESDVKALASVVSYKKVKPPLAIGLFGHWGSGKSFFMNKLKKEIEENQKKDEKVYCKQVVQVSFNSWHYSDSNLWASLITKIFEELKKHGSTQQKPLEKLYQNLNSVKEAKEDAEVELKKVTDEKNKITQWLNEAKQTIQEQTQNLKEVSEKDILNAVWNDAKVKENVSKIRELIPDALITNVTEMNAKANELRSFADQVIESIQIAYKFKYGKMFLALLAALTITLTYYCLKAEDGQPFSILRWLTSKSSIALAALSQLTLILGPFKRGVNVAYQNLKSLQETCLRLEEEKRVEKSKSLDAINTLLAAKKEEQLKQEAALHELEKKQTELENEILDIISGRKLHRFIEGRVSDQRYTNSLGIISWIRKDFEELDFLLKMQYEATPEELIKLNRQTIDIDFKVDRIVLYIDDLDRCNQDIVIRVLEAIHLLLAFPLFVVIVGVDPRWMHNALQIKYKEFLSKTNGTDGVSTATSYDYLEKIFQVPFVLKPITDQGKDNLINEQLSPLIKKTPATNITTPNIIDEEKPQQVPDSKTQIASTINNVPVPPTPKPDVQATTTDTLPKEETVVADNTELLNISEDEIKFMQAISFMIGDSPRTINRYINIYRIVRTHAQFEFLDDNEHEHYKAAIILLAMITGYHANAAKIFKKIIDADNDSTFEIFLEQAKTNGNDIDPYLNELSKAMKKDEALKDLGAIELSRFQKNINLISRFSFRNLM